MGGRRFAALALAALGLIAATGAGDDLAITVAQGEEIAADRRDHVAFLGLVSKDHIIDNHATLQRKGTT